VGSIHSVKHRCIVARRDIIVIGGSAGGIEPVLSILKSLPRNIEASIFVAIHLAADVKSTLPQIIGHATNRHAIHPTNDMAIEPGTVYVAPADRHLTIRDGKVEASIGPKQNGHRPSIDVLFRSAAYCCGPRVIGVILSGMLDDGVAGLSTIIRRGGVSIAQDPRDAPFPDMPNHAIDHNVVQHILPVSQIAPMLQRLVEGEELEERSMIRESLIPARGEHPSVFVCPECGGTLFETPDDTLMQYTCRVGHTYSPETLLHDQKEKIEATIWAAMRMFEEKSDLLRRMIERAQSSRAPRSAKRYEDQQEEIQDHLAILRSIIEQNGTFEPTRQ
jgi:two-component system chemotaxis response regulator CheB